MAEAWNAAVTGFLADRDLPPEFQQWASGYSGTGRGSVERDALPEPFLGRLSRQARVVFLALNPGQADLSFQGRDGIFAQEIRRAGSYAAWAASWPYLRDPWVATKGKNRHLSTRLQFVRTWVGDPNLPQDGMVSFELYPWHSTGVTGRMQPDPAVVEEFVWRPVAEIAAPVFAFGKPWFRVLEQDLGLEVVDRLGPGGRGYGSTVASRSVTVLKNLNGVTVVAEKHMGGAGPPSREETILLRQALDAWL